ncbi:MAG TPA: FtsX-like permease family protein [Candidatus Limnocylindrales bacterium]|nr:FtsX-like permease family protein [Candidatus Limnocylindrales bacterium]
MRRLSSLALRTVLARPARSGLTIAGVALGVGVLLAVLITNVGIARGSERAVADLLGAADLRVSAFEERGLDAASVDAIAEVEGIERSTASIDQQTYVLSTIASGIAESVDPVRVRGVDPATFGLVHEVRLADGTTLATGDADVAVISRTLADELGLTVGGEVTLLGDADLGPLSLEVRGVLAAGDPRPVGVDRTVLIPLATAQRLFGTDGVHAVDVVVAADASAEAVTAAIEQRLVTRPYIVATADELTASLQGSTAEFRALAAMVAAVVLFVAAFLIFNTLSMTVSERLGEVALLRAAGATAGQVYRLVLSVAALIGVVGSTLGIIVGVALAAFAAWYVRSIDGFPIDEMVVPPAAIVIALGIGFLTTVVSGIEPALRAARVRPVEALRAGRDQAVGERARLRWLIVVFAVVAGAAVLLSPTDVGPAGIIRSLIVYGLLLIAALCVPLLLGPLGRLVGLAVRPFARAEERLSRGSIARDRSRAALSAGALGVGLAMVVGLATVSNGARAAGTEWLADVIPGDIVVTSIRPVGPDEGIEPELRAVPGVARVTPFASIDIAHEGARLSAVATVGRDLLDDGRLRFVGGDREVALAALDAGGSTILPRAVATRLGLSVGDDLRLTTAGGSASLAVAGIVERSMPGSTGEAVIVGYGDALERFGAAGADLFAIRYAADAPTSTADTVDEVARSYALTPTPVGDLEGSIGDALDHILGLFDAVALLAVLVAGLGVANTFAMSVIERVPEIGVLRATGMTRRQVGRMVLVEALMLGGVGAIVGCGVGVLVGAAMIALGGGRISALPLPSPGVLIAAALIGLAVPVVAATYPARTAGRIPIVRAVAFR